MNEIKLDLLSEWELAEWVCKRLGAGADDNESHIAEASLLARRMLAALEPDAIVIRHDSEVKCASCGSAFISFRGILADHDKTALALADGKEPTNANS